MRAGPDRSESIIALRMPIAAVMVHVADPRAALDWYALLFPRARRHASADGRFSFLVLDGIQLEFVASDSKVASGAAGSVVYWHVPSLGEALARFVAAGATLYRGPMLIEHGLAMCQVRDPWGNCIGLRGPATMLDSMTGA